MEKCFTFLMGILEEQKQILTMGGNIEIHDNTNNKSKHTQCIYYV
jgi:hypothetical protein